MKAIAISICCALSFYMQAQPKYTKLSSNQSGFKVRNLDGYKENEGLKTNNNPLTNSISYKNSPVIRPESKGEKIFPEQNAVPFENSLVSESNYKIQNSRKNYEKSIPVSPIKEEKDANILSKEQDQ